MFRKSIAHSNRRQFIHSMKENPMIIKKHDNFIFKNILLSAFFLITASGMLKADDIKETAKKALGQLEEKSQELTEEAKYQLCSAQCYKYYSDDEKLFKWVCFKKCELTHQAREYKSALRKFFEKVKSELNNQK